MVTSRQIDENQIDNRGSKSDELLPKVSSVKEQRVDGSWYTNLYNCILNNFMCFVQVYLRYTLMGHESVYQIKIPSNQLNKSSLIFLNYLSNSTVLNPNKINPWWLSGFIDAEGCFLAYISRSKTHKIGWSVEPKFELQLHIREHSLILQIQEFQGGIGKVYFNPAKNTVVYSHKKDLF